jgi:hypothetical protein
MSITSPGGEVVIPLTSEGTTIFVNTWTPTQNDLQLYPHVVMLSPHPWDPRSVQFPQPSQSTKEEFEMRRKVAALAAEKTMTEWCNDDSASLFDLGQITNRLISSIRIKEGPTIAMAEALRAVAISHVQQDVSLPKTFQTKGRHSSITPQDLSERLGN